MQPYTSWESIHPAHKYTGPLPHPPPMGTPPKQIMQATLIVESLTKEYYFYLAAANVNGSFRNI